jgi:hypothetical protein
MGLTVWDGIQAHEKFSAPVLTGARAQLAFCKMIQCYYFGVNQPGRGFYYPFATNAEVKGRADIQLYSPSLFNRI